MGEDQKTGTIFYSIDGITEKMQPLGQGLLVEMPKLANGGLEEEKYMELAKLGEGATFECTIVPRTISKKRFIKLLMGMGYQRNTANKMHQKYMEMYKSRTKIGMICFEAFYKQEMELEFEIRIERGK